MRIVVHPALQRQGVASLLLKRIENSSTTDYLSCSFGATTGLLEFWNKQGFEAVRMGLSRDASSGSHSAIMMKPLTDQGQALFSKARIQFWRYFPVLLLEPLRDLEIELIEVLEQTRLLIPIDEELEVNVQDQQDIHSFAYGYRGYENCMLALQKCVHKSVKNEKVWSQINDNEKIILQQKILEKKSWLEVSQQVSLSGRKQVLKKLRDIIQHIVELSSETTIMHKCPKL
jgi:tRNA(Met) cytidine acetyltransferase